MKLITIADAARMTGVVHQSIGKAMKRGELRRIEIAGRPFVDEADVKEWMQRPRFRAVGRRPKQSA